MSAVAALFVDAKGPYPELAARECLPHAGDPDWDGSDSIDCWDITRDARKYDGPHPVVAHPPCKHWRRLAHLAHRTCLRCGWHGPTSKCREENGTLICPTPCAGVVASDADCAPRAVEQVRKWGGVLEHPAGSKLWDEPCGPGLKPLWEPRSEEPEFGKALRVSVDNLDGSYTIEVDQVEFGHVARKRTWLYLVGVPRSALEPPPFPGREPTHHVSRDAKRAARNGYTLKRTGSRQNLLTPPLFAEYLIRLARAAGEARAVKEAANG